MGAEKHKHYYHRDKQRCNHNPSFNHFDFHGTPPSDRMQILLAIAER
jgi:hypothetical protein